jgi:hypothetical protein
MKTCLNCNIAKPLSEYHKDKSRKSGLREKCKSCRCKHPENVFKKCIACNSSFTVKGFSKAQKYCSDTCQIVYIKYKINKFDFFELLKLSNNKCSICNKEERNVDIRTGKIYRLSIDHCHTTGKVRGLLCSSCNAGLGYFKDDIDIMKKAILYIKKHK